MKNYGTLINAPIRPNDNADSYPVALSNEIQGGVHLVNTVTDRDNIPSERRQEGMLVFVSTDQKTFQLFGGVTNDHWIEVDFGNSAKLAFQLNSVPYPETTTLNIQGAGASALYDVGTKKFTLLIPGMNTWRGAWAENTPYALNDLVHYNGNVYIATQAHTSTSTTPDQDINKWDTFASRGSVGITWKGTWDGGTYKLYDAVTYNGSTYICILEHTNIVPTNEAYWNLLVSKGDTGPQGPVGPQGPPGIYTLTYAGHWSAAVTYSVNNFVSYDGALWFCNTNNQGNNVPGVSPFWDLMVGKGDPPAHEWNPPSIRFQNPDGTWGPYVNIQGTKGMVWRGDWSDSTDYPVDSVVYYNGSSYILTDTIIAGEYPKEPSKNSKWQQVVEKGDVGITYRGVWNSQTTYYRGDMVFYEGSVYMYIYATPGITSEPTDISQTPQWQLVINGIQYRGTFDSNNTYYPYQMVSYDGRTYILNQTTPFYPTSNQYAYPGYYANWVRVTPDSFVYRGNWVSGQKYYYFDIVKFKNCYYLYQNLNPKYSSIDPPKDSDWALWQITLSFKGDWSAVTTYYLGDVVKYEGAAYICNVGQGIVPPTDPAKNPVIPGTDDSYTKIVDKGDTGPQGPPGVGLTASYDSYDPRITYPPLTLVRHNGKQWYTKIETTGIEPAEGPNWGLFTDSGPQGIQGPPGPKGMTWKGAWNAAIQYSIADAVGYEGNIYYALTTNTNKIPTTSPNDWDLFVQRGEKGLPLVYRGQWSKTTLYLKDDTVHYNGNIYIALRDNTNVTPGSSAADWEVFVSKGDQGPIGPPGPQGSQGEQGPPGINLFPFGQWDINTTYEPGALVSWDGSTWECIATNMGITPGLQPQYWRLFVSKGDPGLQWKGTYSGSTQYYKRDVVYRSGASYICLMDGVISKDPSYPPYQGLYWDIFTVAVKGDKGDQGERGPAGVGLTYLGDYDPTESYPTNVLVSYQGNTYYSILASYGKTPSTNPTYWKLFVIKGEVGPAGPPGPAGPQGPQGLPGSGLIYAGQYSSSELYALNTLVGYNNKVWRSKTSTQGNAPTEGSPFWELFLTGEPGPQGNPGPQGAPGTGVTFFGNWADSTNYPQYAIVVKNDIVYIATQSHTSSSTNAPDVNVDYWAIISKPGPQGLKGDTGEAGPMGPQGPRGFSGASLNFAGTWSAEEAYSVNDLVAYEGSTWVCLQPNSNIIPREGTYWTVFVKRGPMGPQGYTGPQGPKGDPGGSFLFAGTWDGTISYPKDTLVTYNGSAYVSLQASANKSPESNPTYWIKIVAKGDKGDKGDRGETGPQGPQGFTGPQGPKGDRGLPGAGLIPLGTWDSLTTYGKWSLVTYNGSSYYANVDNQNVIPSSNSFVWTLFASKGDQGVQGIQGPQGPVGPEGPVGPQGLQGVPGMVYKGTWSSTTPYANGDVVFYNGNSFICVQANNNQIPQEGSTYWSFLSKRSVYNFHAGAGITIQQNDPDVTITNTIDSAQEIVYQNTDYPTFGSVKDALDKLLYAPVKITSFTGGATYEKGITVVSIVLDWTINRPITSQNINGTSYAVDVRHAPISGLSLTTDTTFTLTATDNVSTDTAQIQILLRNKRYWGVSSSASLTDAQIIALNSEFATDRIQTRVFDCTGGQYFYIIYPSAWGAATFKVGGMIQTDFLLTTRSFTNASGWTESYNIYRIYNLQHGSKIQVEVS